MFVAGIFGIAVNVIWYYLLLVLWIAIAFWPSRVASRKGRSFIGFFILRLIFFPLSLVLAYTLPAREGQTQTPTRV